MKLFTVFIFALSLLQVQAKKLVGNYKFKPKQSYVFDVSINSNLNYVYLNPENKDGKKQLDKLRFSNRQQVSYQLSVELKEKDRQFNSLIVKLLKYQRQSIDSVGATPVPDQWMHFNMDSVVNKYLANRAYFVKTDKVGNVINVTTPINKLSSFEMDSLQYTMLMQFWDKDNFSRLLKHVIPVYPRNPVVKGDEWSNVFRYQAGFPVTVYEVYGITSFERGEIRLQTTGKPEIDTSILNQSSGDLGINIVSSEATGNGTVIVSGGNVLKKKNSNLVYRGEAVSDDLPIEINCTITLDVMRVK